MTQDSINYLISGSFVVLIITLYFLPSWIASIRNHHNFWPIAVVNLFFGLTLLGWVICLAWSLSQVKIQEIVNKSN